MAVRAVSAPLAQLPNALTVARYAAIPPFVLLLLRARGERSTPAAALFVGAAATDQVDGWLARRWAVESQFGKLADPLADRLMIDAAVVLLWRERRLPSPALALVAARDVLLVGGYQLVRERGYEFEVNALGKAATWVLYASLAGVLVTDRSARWPLALFWGGLALAVAAAGAYVARARRTVRP